MSTPIKSLLASFKDSTELVDVHETYSEFSHDLSAFASRRTLKSEVADYFFNAKPLSLTTPPGPPILLPRLPTAGEPPQVAELTRARKNNAVLLEHIKADPLWLARRMPGQEAFRSVSRCFKFDTYYVAEEGTICFIQGARKLTYKQRKVVGKSENYSFNVFLVVPAYTVHQIFFQAEGLMTVGHVISQGKDGEDGQGYTTLKLQPRYVERGRRRFIWMFNDKTHYLRVPLD